MAKKKKSLNPMDDDMEGTLFVGFLLLGLGTGFLVGNLPAYLFFGMGIGFIAMFIASLRKK